jgi:hypothetical protein
MKRLFAAIGLVAIAACSTAPNNSIVPSGGSMSTDTARHSPISDLFVQSDLGQNNIQPNKSKAIVIKSIGLSGSINGTPGNVYFNTKQPCKVVDKGGLATGCGVKNSGTSPIKLSKVTAYLFTQPKAKGCVVGISQKYSGTVNGGESVPFKFKWTGKC